MIWESLGHSSHDERPQPPTTSTLRGVGDDAAVLDPMSKRVVVTTDMLCEGVHFDLSYAPLKHSQGCGESERRLCDERHPTQSWWALG